MQNTASFSPDNHPALDSTPREEQGQIAYENAEHYNDTIANICSNAAGEIIKACNGEFDAYVLRQLESAQQRGRVKTMQELVAGLLAETLTEQGFYRDPEDAHERAMEAV